MIFQENLQQFELKLSTETSQTWHFSLKRQRQKSQSALCSESESESELSSPAAALDARCDWTSAKNGAQIEALVPIGSRNSFGVNLSLTLSQLSGLWRPSVVPRTWSCSRFRCKFGPAASGFEWRKETWLMGWVRGILLLNGGFHQVWFWVCRYQLGCNCRSDRAMREHEDTFAIGQPCKCIHMRSFPQLPTEPF